MIPPTYELVNAGLKEGKRRDWTPSAEWDTALLTCSCYLLSLMTWSRLEFVIEKLRDTHISGFMSTKLINKQTIQKLFTAVNISSHEFIGFLQNKQDISWIYEFDQEYSFYSLWTRAGAGAAQAPPVSCLRPVLCFVRTGLNRIIPGLPQHPSL